MKYLTLFIVIAAMGCSSNRNDIESTGNKDNNTIKTNNPEVQQAISEEKTIVIRNGVIVKHKVIVNGETIFDFSDESADELKAKITPDAQKAFDDLEAIIDKEMGISK
jgi:hypothetical protein